MTHQPEPDADNNGPDAFWWGARNCLLLAIPLWVAVGLLVWWFR